MLLAMLRGADEHLDQIIVQAVEDLPLESPLKLRVLQIARMQFEVVRMDSRIAETRTNDYLHRFALFACVELD